MLDSYDKYDKFTARPPSAAMKGRPLPSIFRSDSTAMRKKSRSHLTRLESSRTSEGKEIIHERKKTMTQASASSRTIVDKFLERIKVYHTYQPLLPPNDPLERQRKDDDPSKSNPWEIIDNLINVSTQNLVRHQADEHFFSTFGRVTGESFRPSQKKRSHKVGFTNRENDRDLHGISIEKRHRAFMDVWKRDHPAQSKEALQEESSFWHCAFSGQESKERAEYLQELHRQVEELSKLSVTQENFYNFHSQEDNNNDKVERNTRTKEDEKERQKRCWNIFCKGEAFSASKGFLEKSSPIVLENARTDDSQQRIHFSWTQHSHKHENAALVIQKSFRCYQAKCIVDRKLSARYQLLHEILAVEEEAQEKWKAALQEDSRREAKKNENTPEYRALNLVSKRILALVAKKRAMKQMEKEREEELQNYAATLIQKVFRGYFARTRTVLTPRTRASRLEEKRNAAAFRIQGTLKRRLALRRWEDMRKAAIKIQCCYRKFTARRTLTCLRGFYRIELEDAEREKAAHTLVGFGVKNIYRRKQFYKKHKEYIDLLQRVGRGYLHRAFVHSIPWQQEKEAACKAIISYWKDVLEIRRAKFFRRSFELRRERENWQMTRTDAAQTIQSAWKNYIGKVKRKQCLLPPSKNSENSTRVAQE